MVLLCCAVLLVYRGYSSVLAILQSHRSGKRPLATGSGRELLRTLLSMIGASLLSPVLLVTQRPEKPVLAYKDTLRNRMIVAETPTISSYNQCFWLAHPFLQYVA